MNYTDKKSLVVAGLITIGSDGDVTDHEMRILHGFLQEFQVSPGEEQKILKEITPRLASTAAKGALLKEVTRSLSTDKKKEILRACCTLMFSDMQVKENEVKTLKKIGMVMTIPEVVFRGIINQELAKHEQGS